MQSRHTKKALSINPRDAEVLHNLGNAYAHKEMIDDAISSYKRAVEINPNLSESHENIAYLHKKEGTAPGIRTLL